MSDWPFFFEPDGFLFSSVWKDDDDCLFPWEFLRGILVTGR